MTTSSTPASKPAPSTTGRRGGRKPGSKNKKTLLREELLQLVLQDAEDILMAELPKIIKTVVKKAQAGDMQAAKLILDRSIPAKKAIEYMERRDVKIDVIIRTEAPTINVTEHDAPALEGDCEDVSDKHH